MAEARIAARLADVHLLAGVKAAADASHARLIHWTGPIANDSMIKDSDVIVLETTGADVAIQELQRARTACPAAHFIVLAGVGATPEDVRKLFRAGARDVLAAPVSQDQIMAAVAEALGPDHNKDVRGAVFGMVKASGGVGATTIAVNLAGFLANPPQLKKETRPAARKVLLIDFDIQLGDIALALDLAPRKDLTEILRTPKRFDAHFLDAVVERHRSGVHVLSAPLAMLPLDAVEANVANAIVDVAASCYDVVVFELPCAWTDWTGALLRRADHVLLISSPSVRGAAGARRIVDTAAELGIETGAWRLAFNRMHSMLDGRDLIDQASRSLAMPVLGVLSEDPAVRGAGDRGRLIWDAAPSARFAKDLRQLCNRAVGLIDANRRQAGATAR